MIGHVEIPALSDAQNATLNELLDQLASKQYVNTLRSRYFESKQTTQHMNISIPPQFNRIENVIGLPAKAVTALESRIDLDGFVVPGGSASDFGIDRIWSANKLSIEATMAHTTALKYGVAFVAVMDQGLPQPVLRALSPLNTTALWDADRRRAKAALTVVDRMGDHPIELILYLEDAVYTCVESDGVWRVDRAPHRLGRCPVAVLPFKPSLEDPFGRSRISKPVMSITDRLVRTLLRMEVNAEFYSSPQRALLGGDPDMFTDKDGNPIPGWSSLLSKMLVVPHTELDDGTFQRPEVQQFQQLTMQPHLDMVRSDVALFSGETGIPVGALGVIHDNPSSDAAMKTAYLDLDKDAERAHDSFGSGWVDAVQMAVMVREGLSVVPDELELLKGKFRNPATTTKAASAQWAMQLVQVGVLPPDSEVVLEEVGLDETQVQRILADRRKSTAGGLLTQMLQQGAEPAAVDEAAQFRSKFEALGVAIRAGVSGESAAELLGLSGIEFTGAVPVSLRMPESEAADLEES